ncbi:hemolysin-III related-domain-containing protein [Dioszegia hungarica]|uniref:Hemolysin-III related-domain-containing protein n=1 Tax=Dioszegia hungarica TaxID=4972 RepID=A0AA38H549_9TREE|nr:hemolysin-III related-domain-containing protein [Dioszegia hungarica]KAI9632784.1 hemolysin-III related-domain-containing protein [Dioszegia hungarica]
MSDSTETTPLVPDASAGSNRAELLSYEESLKQLPWQTDNPWILTGYRRQLHTIRACLWSAVASLHNETINIHTHSIGALIFAALIPLHLTPHPFPALAPFLPHPSSWTGRHDPAPVPPTLHDRVALTAYLLCAVACLSLSAWFHTIQPCNKKVCLAGHSGDYTGIVILIVGSILPGMYYAFHDSPRLQAFYMVLISSAGLGAAWMVLSPYGRAHRWHRTLTFIGLGLSSILPIGHVVATRGLDIARGQMSLDLVIASGASYIFGAVLYAARFPERHLPGKVDFIGNSHQIFHVFVLFGAWFQYAALRGMAWGRGMAVGG